MTNEEKAKEICRGYNYYGRLTPQGVAGFAVDRCKEMAKWKDKQFKEYLEKKKKPLMEAYRSIEQNKNEGGTVWCNPILFIDDIIDELFKE